MNNNFPIQYLPPTILNAVEEVQRNTQFPLPMIALSALSAAAAACQNSIDVRLPTGQISPTSLFTLVIADSGEGKTPCDGFFNRALSAFEETQIALHNKELKNHQALDTTWLIEKDVLEQAIRKNKKKGIQSPKSEDVILDEFETLQNKYSTHLDLKPQKPKKFKVIYNNTTPEKMLQNLNSEWPSATLISSEAGNILQGHAFNDLPSLNLLWDGAPINVDRISSPSFILKDARLSLSLMLQQNVFEKFKNGRGKNARGIGFFARFLLTAPESTKGYRTISFQPQSWSALDAFNARIHEILTRDKIDVENGRQERSVMEFSEEARKKWIFKKNDLEITLSPGNYYADVDDAVSKMHTNIARMAAIFQFFEGHGSTISENTLIRAGEIAIWFLEEFRKIFTILPIEITDAMALEKMLFNWCRNHPGYTQLPKKMICQFGPPELRKNSYRRERAITELCYRNIIQITYQGKAQIIMLNQDYFCVSY